MPGLGGRFFHRREGQGPRSSSIAPRDPGETLDYGLQQAARAGSRTSRRGHRGRDHVQEAPSRMQEEQIKQQGGQARHAGAAGRWRRNREDSGPARRSSRKTVAQTELADARPAGGRAPRSQQEVAHREREEDARQESRPSAPRRRSSRRSTRPPRRKVKIGEAASGVGEQMGRPRASRLQARQGQDRADEGARPARWEELEGRGHIRRHHPARPARRTNIDKAGLAELQARARRLERRAGRR